MAIHFARCEPISRRVNRHVVQRIAYVARENLRDERLHHTWKEADTDRPEHVKVMLATAPSDKYYDLSVIANAINNAERRRDACTGYEFVFPQDPALSKGERITQIEEFVSIHFLSKGVPVIYGLHYPDDFASNPDSRNFHAHAVVGTRALTKEGFARTKAPDLSPKFAQAAWGAVVSQAQRWGKIWADFQDEWFARHGKAIRVDPLLPIPEQHLGPKRFQHPLSDKVRRVADIRQRNTHLQAMAARATWDNLNRDSFRDHNTLRLYRGQTVPTMPEQSITGGWFTTNPSKASLYGDVSYIDINFDDIRYFVRGHGGADEFYTTDPNIMARPRIPFLHPNATKEPTHLAHVRQPQQIARPVLNILKTAQQRLTFEAIAWGLNPRYAKAQRTLHKANADLVRARQEHEIAEYRINERWGEMGVLGRAAHVRWKPRMNKVQKVLHGAIRDTQLGEWEARRGGALKRIRAAGKIIKLAEREVAKEFEAIRPAAEAELQRRQLIAENARVEIEKAANSFKPARQSTRHRARL